MTTFQDGTYTGLTPDEVATKRFTPVRGGREGYDMEEVDAFLDEVEASIIGLAQAYTQAAELYEDADKRAAASAERIQELENELVRLRDQAQYSAPSAAPTAETTSIDQASNAAAKLLAHATATAESIEASAQEERNRILSETESHAQARHQEIEENFQAAALDLEEKRAAALDDLEVARVNLTAEVEGLRQFESNVRGELSAYLSDLQARVQGPLAPASETVQEEVSAEEIPTEAVEPEAVEAPDYVASEETSYQVEEPVEATEAEVEENSDTMPEPLEVQDEVPAFEADQVSNEAPSFADYQEEKSADGSY